MQYCLSYYIMLYGDYTYYGEQWVMYRIIGSICCIPETNKTLYFNYTSIIIIKQFQARLVFLSLLCQASPYLQQCFQIIHRTAWPMSEHGISWIIFYQHKNRGFAQFMSCFSLFFWIPIQLISDKPNYYMLYEVFLSCGYFL